LEIVPDNYSIYKSFENENERLERIHRQQEIEEEIEVEDLPFYERSEEE